MTRVYIPATLEMLKRLVAVGELRPVNGTAFAVTPALREAGLASLRLLGAAEPGLPLRRAVLVADADDARPRPDLDDAVVRVSGPVPLERVICAHVDNAAAEKAVAAAIEAIDAADIGDEDAELAVGDAQDHDLAWYAPQELPFLLELL